MEELASSAVTITNNQDTKQFVNVKKYFGTNKSYTIGSIKVSQMRQKM